MIKIKIKNSRCTWRINQLYALCSYSRWYCAWILCWNRFHTTIFPGEVICFPSQGTSTVPQVYSADTYPLKYSTFLGKYLHATSFRRARQRKQCLWRVKMELRSSPEQNSSVRRANLRWNSKGKTKTQLSNSPDCLSFLGNSYEFAMRVVAVLDYDSMNPSRPLTLLLLCCAGQPSLSAA